MTLRHWLTTPLSLFLCFGTAGTVAAQCPIFTGTEAYQELENTVATPHWFQCVGSVTADPAPFTFELSAQPATHTGVVVDWGDGSPPENIGTWNGASAIPHTYTPTEWRT